MHEQFKRMKTWSIRKAILLSVLSFSIMLLWFSLYHFAQRNHWLEREVAKTSETLEQAGNFNNGWAYSGTGISIFLIVCVFVLLLREIRVRRKMVDELRIQKELYRITISSMSEGLITTGKQGEILFMNATAERLTGWSCLEAKNLPLEKVYDVVNEQSGQPIEHIVSRILKKPQIIQFENNTLLQTRDSKKLIISNSGSPLFDAKGKIMGTVLVFNDITDKKKNELELKRNEEKYRTLIEQASDAIFINDLDGNIVEVNDRASAMLGFTKEELTTIKVKDLYTEAELLVTPIMFKELHRGERTRVERNMLHRSGSLIPVEVTAKMFSQGYIMAIVRDISERKRSEAETLKAIERYDILAKATSDTIWDWDMLNNTVGYNSGMTKMFGYQIEQVDDHLDWWKEKIHPDDLPVVTDMYIEFIKNYKHNIQLEYRFRCAGGSYKYIYDRVFILYDADRNPVRVIGAMQDVTYAKEEEKRIAKAIIDAQEQERRYIGQELHDNVNQILVTSLISIGLAKDNKTDLTKVAQYTDLSKEYTLKAINEIRILSHELAPVTFDGESLKDILESLLSGINISNRFKIDFQFDDRITGSINEDVQINLYRILQEQIKNILKYSEADTIEITVTRSENAVCMRTYDNGVGFDAKGVKKGIGLSNMKKRAESFAGKFAVNSQPEKGCEIIIEIPLVY